MMEEVTGRFIRAQDEGGAYDKFARKPTALAVG